MSPKIAIYTGEGSSSKGFEDWDALFLTERTFFQTDWESTCSLLILPGGRDIPYHAFFHGAGNQKIRLFVERGGTYLGICAGAYFASAFIEFDRGRPHEICEERELRFFLGKTIGPLYGIPYDYESEAGARAAKLITDHSSFYSYYNGGCTFIPFKESDNHRILARYGDLPGHPPAVIECRVGRGKAILSGVHLEISPSKLDPSDPHHTPLFAPLQLTQSDRIAFFHQAIFPSALPPIK